MIKAPLAAESVPFAVALAPGNGLVREIGLVSFGALVTALAAQVAVPWEPVPFTLQTMGMAVAGLTLGAKRGALSQLLYLGIGSVGMPVFALGTGGVSRILGPTGGYLVAFVVAAGILGYFAEKGGTKTVLRTAMAVLCGFAVTLTMGTAWLSAYVGSASAIRLGLVPFVLPEIIKALVVTLGLPAAWKLSAMGDRWQ